MSDKIKHISFDIPESEHRKLRLLSIYRGYSMKSLQQEAIRNYIERAPEFTQEKSQAETFEGPDENIETDGFEGMESMTL